jgi:phospholipid-binding lipoprotein MlaA
MRSLSIRRIYLPIAALCLGLSVSGCATTSTLPPEVPAMHSLSEVTDDRVNITPDPWVGSNVFNNIGEIRSLTNCLFQLKGMQTLTTLGRFVTNSTIGIGGLFDPATSMGMERQVEDFGQTLGYWGVGTGNYLVLPLFGPSNVRDTGGLVVDSGLRYALTTTIFNSVGGMSDGTENTINYSMTALETIDKRHQEKFRYNGSEYPFEYEMVRWLGGEKRKLEVIK